MKVLSAVNIHAYERLANRLINTLNIETGLQIVLKKNPEMLIAPTKATGDITGIIVLELKGMAGNFNLPVINRGAGLRQKELVQKRLIWSAQ